MEAGDGEEKGNNIRKQARCRAQQISPCATLQGAAIWPIEWRDTRATVHVFGKFYL